MTKIGGGSLQLNYMNETERSTFKSGVETAFTDSKLTREEFQGLAKNISGGEEKLAALLKELNISADIETAFKDGGTVTLSDDLKKVLLEAQPLPGAEAAPPEKAAAPAIKPAAKLEPRAVITIRSDMDNFWDKLPFNGKTHVQFNNDAPGFQELVSKAKELATNGDSGFFSGEITGDEIKLLEEVALKDGMISHSERLFIDSLKKSGNVDVLKSADFDSHNFVLKIKESSAGGNASPIKRTSGGESLIVSNPLNAKIKDVQKEKDIDDIDDKFIFKDFSAADVKQKVTDSLAAKSPEIREKAEALMSKLSPEDKEAFTYLNRLLNREPPLKPEVLEKLLDKMNTMLTTDYDARAGNSRDLVVSAMHDLALPANIDQVGVGSCAGACIQIEIALKRPEMYLDMLDTLAKGQPFKPPFSHQEIKPNWTFVEDRAGRSISSKIMQNAIMDFADVNHDAQGKRQNADPVNNRQYDSSSGNSKLSGGLFSDEVLRAQRIIFNEDLVTYELGENTTGSDLVEILKKAEPNLENPIQIALHFSRFGSRDAVHAVNVVGIDKDKNEVTYINPWGRQETISLDKLEKRIIDVNARPGLHSP